VATILGLAVVAGACGGSSADSSSGGAAPDPASVQQGGSSVLLTPYDAESFDPAQTINAGSTGGTILSAIYDALYTINPETNEFQPRLATEFTTDDGLTWTMTLRDGVTFSDGTPFNAEAIRVNWERARSDPRAAAWPYMADIASMTAVDDTTFQVLLTAPNYEFRWLPTWSGLNWIASPAAIAGAGDSYGAEPVGAGPFVMESHTPGSETVFARNDTYWQQDLPKLDSLTIRVVADPQASYDTLTSGGADGWLVAPDQFAEMSEDNGGFHLVGTDMIGGSGWLLNGNQPPFDDIRARQAVYHTADQQALLDTVADGAGEVPRTFLPESSPYYDESQEVPQPDPEEAQRLLDELADEGEPLSFTIVAPGGDAYTHAVALQTQLSAFDNIEVEVEQQDGATYGTNLYSGEFEMAIYGMLGGHPEPVVRSLTSDHAIPIASHGNEEIDAAVADARATRDEEARQEAYNRLFTAMNEEYRLIWRNRQFSWVVMSSEVTGITTYGQGTALLDSYGRVG
jgi:peptide/nickel transport system substrate-binding protein